MLIQWRVGLQRVRTRVDLGRKEARIRSTRVLGSGEETASAVGRAASAHCSWGTRRLGD
jgi:hypothetical protein